MAKTSIDLWFRVSQHVSQATLVGCDAPACAVAVLKSSWPCGSGPSKNRYSSFSSMTTQYGLPPFMRFYFIRLLPLVWMMPSARILRSVLSRS